MIYLHQLTTEWFCHIARVLFSRNFATSKFPENKVLAKFPNIQYYKGETEAAPLFSLCISLGRSTNALPLKFTHSTSDSFTILGLWVLGLATSNINESPLQTNESQTLFLMTSLTYYCIPGLAGTRWNKKLCAKDAGCAVNKITVVLSSLPRLTYRLSVTLICKTEQSYGELIQCYSARNT